MMLMVAALAAPLVGFTDDDSHTAHRINLDGLPMADWATAEHCRAVCGAAVKLYAHADNEPAQWRGLRTRGTPVHRCPTCNGRAS